ncbi:hypothetical protein ACF3DV_02605 [Chlorogloeopsis fritschii PCC 9212]|uniref:hypothetical protein n=1 Tax=Chlorogloeopsis fritschii TaxID=1124 RepID=UPI0012FD3CA7|nr:hypothetical protein [Chlorogloeopsis fritschii]
MLVIVCVFPLSIHSIPLAKWAEILTGCGGSLGLYSDTLLGCWILAKVLLGAIAFPVSN